MSNNKVTVWYDDTSDEHGYVVDVVYPDESTSTVNVCDDLDEALEFGRNYASKSNCEFIDLTSE